MSNEECSMLIDWAGQNAVYLDDDEKADLVKATFDYAKVIEPLYNKFMSIGE